MHGMSWNPGLPQGGSSDMMMPSSGSSNFRDSPGDRTGVMMHANDSWNSRTPGDANAAKKCPLCQKILLGEAVFNKHLADCKSKKAICPWCGHRSRHSGNLRVHVRNNHPEHLQKYEEIKHTL